jgi:hypothetical protein
MNLHPQNKGYLHYKVGVQIQILTYQRALLVGFLMENEMVVTLHIKH